MPQGSSVVRPTNDLYLLPFSDTIKSINSSYRIQATRTCAVSNPLNTQLNPICHLLALLGAHHILHVSRMRVNWCQSLHLFFGRPNIPAPLSPAVSVQSSSHINTAALFNTASKVTPTGIELNTSDQITVFKNCSNPIHHTFFNALFWGDTKRSLQCPQSTAPAR